MTLAMTIIVSLCRANMELQGRMAYQALLGELANL